MDPVWRNLPKNDAVKIEEEDDLDLKEISEYFVLPNVLLYPNSSSNDEWPFSDFSLVFKLFLGMGDLQMVLI